RQYQKIHLRSGVISLSMFLLVSIQVAGQKKPTATASGSAASYQRALQVIEAGITALGGIDAIRAADSVKVRVRGHSFARNQSVAVDPPYDRMSHDEDMFIDLKNRKYVVETRDPLPGGFVFGGKQVISGGQGFFVDPRNKTITQLNLAAFNNIGIIRR